MYVSDMQRQLMKRQLRWSRCVRTGLVRSGRRRGTADACMYVCTAYLGTRYASFFRRKHEMQETAQSTGSQRFIGVRSAPSSRTVAPGPVLSA